MDLTQPLGSPNRNEFVRFSGGMYLWLSPAAEHKHPPMTPELLQLSLALMGALVAFLLAKELATGYVWWRSRRRDGTKR